MKYKKKYERKYKFQWNIKRKVEVNGIGSGVRWDTVGRDKSLQYLQTRTMELRAPCKIAFSIGFFFYYLIISMPMGMILYEHHWFWLIWLVLWRKLESLNCFYHINLLWNIKFQTTEKIKDTQHFNDFQIYL